VESNPHSWNEHANMIFLDQPVEAGFSYADGGLPSTPMSAAKAAVDVYAFLQLFFERFPELGHKPFHIAGEVFALHTMRTHLLTRDQSWGGHFVPQIASLIFNKNKATNNKIDLASIMIGNGMTDPLRQFPPLAEYMCEGPYALLESGSKECTALYEKSVRCERMIQACYDYQNALVCAPAERYCWGLMQPALGMCSLEDRRSGRLTRWLDAKKNHYDIRKPCSDAERENLCYTEVADMEIFLNQPHVQAQLGVDPNTTFKACNMKITLSYAVQGGLVWNTARVVPELIEGGIRVLAYAGNTDAVCNFMGIEAFVGGLPTSYAGDFAAAKPKTWTVGNRTAGYVRTAGGNGKTAGNQTFVAVYEAG
jgi:cathepsin A (carboxypeptidase C)